MRRLDGCKTVFGGTAKCMTSSLSYVDKLRRYPKTENILLWQFFSAVVMRNTLHLFHVGGCPLITHAISLHLGSSGAGLWATGLATCHGPSTAWSLCEPAFPAPRSIVSTAKWNRSPVRTFHVASRFLIQRYRTLEAHGLHCVHPSRRLSLRVRPAVSLKPFVWNSPYLSRCFLRISYVLGFPGYPLLRARSMKLVSIKPV